MHNVQVIILAAGAGKRMGSDLPKVLMPVGGKPLIKHLLDTLDAIGFSSPPAIVVGHQKDLVIETLGPRYTYIEQLERKGTAHAIRETRDILKDRGNLVMTFFGDTPLASKNTIENLIDKAQKEKPAITLAVTHVPDFAEWRGGLSDFARIVRDKNGRIMRNVEKGHLTPLTSDIKELNPGFYCFDAAWLWKNVDKIPPTPPTNEHYLPHAIDLAISQGRTIATVEIDPRECLGANTPEHLSLMEAVLF